MSNIAIATPILSDAATVTATDELGNFPVTNLQTKQPSVKWRTAGLSPAVVIDLGSAGAINLVGLFATNTTSAATWRIRAAASEANLTASPGYDSGSVAAWPETGMATDWPAVNLIHWLTAAQTFQWWRIDLADAGNPAGYLQAGRVYVAAAWQPTRNLQRGWSIEPQDESETFRAQGGQEYDEIRPQRRIAKFRLAFLSEDELYDNVFEIDRRQGRTGDVFVMRDPTHASHLHKQSVYGTLKGSEPAVNQAALIFEKSYQVRELL